MNQLSDIFETIAANHPELQGSGFAHLANVGRLEDNQPYNLDSDLVIRRAAPNEIETLQTLVILANQSPPIIPTRNPYETSVYCQGVIENQTSFSKIELSADQWKYHVIGFTGSNSRVHDFINASMLTCSRLELGPTVLSMTDINDLTLFFDIALSRLWKEMSNSDDPFVTLNKESLDDLLYVYKKLSDLEEDIVGLKNAMRQFAQLDEIPKDSPLRFLGYMSILESMLSHAPKQTDPYDSLTRQIRQKMLLIGRRSCLPIPYEKLDQNTDPRTLWTRLYEYRSKIAHGGTVDFSGKLQCLRNSSAALDFILYTTVAVMRQALEEPELIADLKAC